MAHQNQPEQSEGIIVKLVTNLVRLAVINNASDVHIEPEEDKIRIRFRIDGVLREVETHPISLHEPLVARIKVLSNLDIAERRKPQDGRFQLATDNKQLDVRVSTFPTMYGENVELRILNKTNILLGLPSLGFAPDTLKQYTDMIHQPYGIIFVTGPNGSGKTTTLYSTLNTINTPDKDIATLEDPVEYQLPLIRQTQVDPEAGLDFAAGLRSLLRQDPDVILVGEVRDAETASISVRAALTGHLVLTTLHTNDSAGAINRLVDMNVEPVLIASATVGVLAQRLVRLLCTTCAESYDVSPTLKAELGLGKEGQLTFKKGVGCEVCGYTGYIGRTGIFELLAPEKTIRAMITDRASSQDIAHYATQKLGMRTLRQDGIEKVKQGLTSIEEVLRVTAGDIVE
ncbi:MAG: type II/IV secretion system protein [Candidatus Kerfeldbacteria bacterium]|nr:type II/IV secretion system protein [Candidatus Kerfeldbacteria bacterium]